VTPKKYLSAAKDRGISPVFSLARTVLPDARIAILSDNDSRIFFSKDNEDDDDDDEKKDKETATTTAVTSHKIPSSRLQNSVPVISYAAGSEFDITSGQTFIQTAPKNAPAAHASVK
jgi:hypothetical protein